MQECHGKGRRVQGGEGKVKTISTHLLFVGIPSTLLVDRAQLKRPIYDVIFSERIGTFFSEMNEAIIVFPSSDRINVSRDRATSISP